MKVRDLLQYIDKIAPFAKAQEWDNVGLIVGELNAEVRRVGVTLDPTSEAVSAAAQRDCQVLLSHHPLLFHAIKKIDLNADPGRAVKEAVKNNITILAAHTNWDCAIGGVNDELARLIGLENILPLDVRSGIGVRGTLAKPTPLPAFLEYVKNAWGLSRLDCYTPTDGTCSIMHVALCGGAGADFWPAAKAWGADLYLTADMKYHELIDATRAGLTIAIAEHGEMERVSIPVLARCLELAAREKGDELETVVIDVKALTPPLRV